MSFVETAEGGQVFTSMNLCSFRDVADIASQRLGLPRQRRGTALTSSVLRVPAPGSLGSGLSKAKQTFERILPQIRWLLGHGLSCQRIADLTEVSEFSVRRALTLENRAAATAMTHFPPSISDAEVSAVHHSEEVAVQPELPIFPEPTARTSERAQASTGQGEGRGSSICPGVRYAARRAILRSASLETTVHGAPCADLSDTGKSS